MEDASSTLLPNLVPIEIGILNIVINQIQTTGWDVDTIALNALSKGKIRNMLTDVQLFGALTAAAMYDYKHPGRSNLFMVKSQHALANECI